MTGMFNSLTELAGGIFLVLLLVAIFQPKILLRTVLSKAGLILIGAAFLIHFVASSGTAVVWIVGALVAGWLTLKMRAGAFLQEKLNINRPISHIFWTGVVILAASGGVAWWLSTTLNTWFWPLWAWLALVMVPLGISAMSEPEEEYIDGAKMVSEPELAMLTDDEQYTFKLGSVKFPSQLEVRHTEVPGSTGVGKSVILSHMLDGIREHAQRAIIVDIGGAFVQRFYDPARGDVILNPIDRRGLPWSPFSEINDVVECSTMAASFIPSGDGQWGYIQDNAQQILADVLTRCIELGQTTNNDLLFWGTVVSVQDLQEFVAGLPSEAHLSPKNSNSDKYRSTVAQALAPLRFMDPAADKNSFSLRGWVRADAAEGFVYFTFTEETFKLLGKIVSTWMDIASLSVLGLSQSDTRRIWLIIDEFASIGKINSFVDFTEKARKKGGCAVILYQSRSQVENAYGLKARTIIGNMNTKIFMSACDEEDMRQISSFLGKARYKKRAKSRGYEGLEAEIRVSEQHELRDIASMSDIRELKIGQAYVALKFYPVCKITFPPEIDRKTGVLPIDPKEASMHFPVNPAAFRRALNTGTTTKPATPAITDDDLPFSFDADQAGEDITANSEAEAERAEDPKLPDIFGKKEKQSLNDFLDI